MDRTSFLPLLFESLSSPPPPLCILKESYHPPPPFYLYFSLLLPLPVLSVGEDNPKRSGSGFCASLSSFPALNGGLQLNSSQVEFFFMRGWGGILFFLPFCGQIVKTSGYRKEGRLSPFFLDPYGGFNGAEKSIKDMEKTLFERATFLLASQSWIELSMHDLIG